MLTVFGSLLAFLFYFRLVYIIFASAPLIQLKVGVPSKALAILLSLATVLLGVVPGILFAYLGWIA
jgi:NADH:ubiquinone oxidoreductase subunit 2 (subunit N)